jgi:cytochrome c biogenesis protein CcmG/thiol:disulfide interchange protein DsbE
VIEGPTGADGHAHPLERRRLRLALLGLLVVVAVGAAIVVLTADLAPARPRVVIGGSPLLDQPAPPIELLDLDGRTVRLADYAGRPVIVNFWATWCEPCKVEFPLFRAARQAHARAGLEILGVIHDDGPRAAAEFAAARDARWPLLQDPDDAAYTAYGVVGLPTTFYVDRGGIVRAASFGPPPSGVLDDQLEKILGGSPASSPRSPRSTRSVADVVLHVGEG